jgi:hypothetical protein
LFQIIKCTFANGGHLFAAINGNLIQLYNTWTFENIANLKGHNGKIKSLSWSKNDSYLISCGSDGAVYGWSILSKKRENENILKGCVYHDATSSQDGGTMYAAGSDGLLKEIKDSQIIKEIKVENTLTQVLLSQNGTMFFASTLEGTIRAVKFPFPDNENNLFQDHKAHSQAVTKIKLSKDSEFLFSVGEDGVLYKFKVSEKGAIGEEKSLLFSNEIILSKAELEEISQNVQDFKNQIDELYAVNEYQIRLKDMTQMEKLKDTHEVFMQDIERLKVDISNKNTERNKCNAMHEQEITVLREKFALEYRQKESNYVKKVSKESEKVSELQKKIVEQQQQWGDKIVDKEEGNKKEIKDLTESFELKLGIKENERQRVNIAA